MKTRAAIFRPNLSSAQILTRGQDTLELLERFCQAPSLMFFFCGRGKVGGDYDRLLRDEIIESLFCKSFLCNILFCFATR